MDKGRCAIRIILYGLASSTKPDLTSLNVYNVFTPYIKVEQIPAQFPEIEALPTLRESYVSGSWSACCVAFRACVCVGASLLCVCVCFWRVQAGWVDCLGLLGSLFAGSTAAREHTFWRPPHRAYQ